MSESAPDVVGITAAGISAAGITAAGISAAGITAADIAAVVDAAIAEDVGDGDLTTRTTVPDGAGLEAVIAAREHLVVAGMPVAEEIFRRLAPEAALEIIAPDGTPVAAGDAIARVSGPAEGILTAERTALNTLQFLSGIATETRRFVAAIEGTGATLLDTRKTVPVLRRLSKYAVGCGGGTNHRMRLDDGILIKDNHIAAAGSLTEAVTRAKRGAPEGMAVQTECDTLDQLREALDAGADRVLLDNMTTDELRDAVALAAGRIPLEASGGVDLTTIRAIAETGVDFISVGAITQRAPAVDIGLDIAWT